MGPKKASQNDFSEHYFCGILMGIPWKSCLWSAGLWDVSGHVLGWRGQPSSKSRPSWQMFPHASWNLTPQGIWGTSYLQNFQNVCSKSGFHIVLGRIPTAPGGGLRSYRGLELRPLLWSKCLCPLKFVCWNPKAQWGGIRRCGLWEVLRSWGWSSHEWPWCFY